MTDLTTLLSHEPGDTDALEQFIACCLVAGGIWEHPRVSDGIPTTRALEWRPGRVRVAGNLYQIDQSVHSFWLKVSAAKVVTWSLHFDPLDRALNSVQGAILAHDRADDIKWRVSLVGAADVRQGALVPVAG